VDLVVLEHDLRRDDLEALRARAHGHLEEGIRPELAVGRLFHLSVDGSRLTRLAHACVRALLFHRRRSSPWFSPKKSLPYGVVKLHPMPSFDIVSQVDGQEVKNAVEQTNKEITNRFDFKGSDARVEQNELLLTVYADDEFKLGQVIDVLRARLAKRNVDVRSLEPGAIEKISGDKVKRPITVKVGVPQEKGKQIQKLVKDSKLKVSASIQGDAVRVSGGKKDDLQAAIQLVKKSVTELPLQFINFRD